MKPFRKGDRVIYHGIPATCINNPFDMDDEGVLINIQYEDGGRATVSICDLSEETDENEDATCPFCREEGFDLIGLKIHLQFGRCEVYEETPLQD